MISNAKLQLGTKVKSNSGEVFRYTGYIGREEVNTSDDLVEITPLENIDEPIYVPLTVFGRDYTIIK